MARPKRPLAVPDFPPMLYVRLGPETAVDYPLYIAEPTIEAVVGAAPAVAIGYYQWVRTVEATHFVQVSTLPPPPAQEILAEAKRTATDILEHARARARVELKERAAAARRRKALRREQRAEAAARTATPRRRRPRLASDSA